MNGTFGERLRQILKDQGRTARWLAARVDVTPTTVSRWMNNQQGVTHANLVACAEALGVPVAAFTASTASQGDEPVPLHSIPAAETREDVWGDFLEWWAKRVRAGQRQMPMEEAAEWVRRMSEAD